MLSFRCVRIPPRGGAPCDERCRQYVLNRLGRAYAIALAWDLLPQASNCWMTLTETGPAAAA